MEVKRSCCDHNQWNIGDAHRAFSIFSSLLRRTGKSRWRLGKAGPVFSRKLFFKIGGGQLQLAGKCWRKNPDARLRIFSRSAQFCFLCESLHFFNPRLFFFQKKYSSKVLGRIGYNCYVFRSRPLFFKRWLRSFPAARERYWIQVSPVLTLCMPL